MKILSIISLIILLNACSHTIEWQNEVADGYQLGNYRIANFSIEPADQTIANDKDFHTFKPFLQQAIIREFSGVGHGEPVNLTIRIKGLSMELNAFTAAMVGDAYRVNADNYLWKTFPQQPIVKNNITAVDGPLLSAGIAGVVASATVDDAEYVQKLAASYAKKLKTSLFPQYRE